MHTATVCYILSCQHAVTCSRACRGGGDNSRMHRHDAHLVGMCLASNPRHSVELAVGLTHHSCPSSARAHHLSHILLPTCRHWLKGKGGGGNQSKMHHHMCTWWACDLRPMLARVGSLVSRWTHDTCPPSAHCPHLGASLLLCTIPPLALGGGGQ